MAIHLSPESFFDLVHAVLIGGIIAVRYLWPVWVLIALLWAVTRLLRAVGGRLGLGPKPRPRTLPTTTSRPAGRRSPPARSTRV